MQQALSAQVIPFPSLPASNPDRNRLDAAFVDLAQALAAHRAAATAWRASLSRLELTVQRLQVSALRYRTQLDALNQGVGRLHLEAQRLERWADSLEELA